MLSHRALCNVGRTDSVAPAGIVRREPFTVPYRPSSAIPIARGFLPAGFSGAPWIIRGRAGREGATRDVDNKIMASVVTVLACVAIPVICAYQYRVTGPRRQLPRDTAQDIHLRRRAQHAASGMGICLGYKWAIPDARTGEGWRTIEDGFGFCFCG